MVAKISRFIKGLLLNCKYCNMFPVHQGKSLDFPLFIKKIHCNVPYALGDGFQCPLFIRSLHCNDLCSLK